MIKHPHQIAVDKKTLAESAAEAHIAPAPRVSVQAFCETVETGALIQAAGADRHLAKAHLKILMGGIADLTKGRLGSLGFVAVGAVLLGLVVVAMVRRARRGKL